MTETEASHNWKSLIPGAQNRNIGEFIKFTASLHYKFLDYIYIYGDKDPEERKLKRQYNATGRYPDGKRHVFMHFCDDWFSVRRAVLREIVYAEKALFGEPQVTKPLPPNKLGVMKGYQTWQTQHAHPLAKLYQKLSDNPVEPDFIAAVLNQIEPSVRSYEDFVFYMRRKYGRDTVADVYG